MNAKGLESGNAAFVLGTTLPWLQDVEGVDAWALWQVTWRDVVILDPANEISAVYNLTQNDLNVPANYDALKALLVAAGGP